MNDSFFTVIVREKCIKNSNIHQYAGLSVNNEAHVNVGTNMPPCEAGSRTLKWQIRPPGTARLSAYLYPGQ